MNEEQTIHMMKQMDKSMIIQSYINLSQAYDEFLANHKQLVTIQNNKIAELEKKNTELYEQLKQLLLKGESHDE